MSEAPKKLSMTTMTEAQKDLLHKIGYSGMFAHRGNVAEAHEYLMSVADACGKQNKIYVITAAQVLVNTLLLQLVEEGIIPTPKET